jgi:hypothetical protein
VEAPKPSSNATLKVTESTAGTEVFSSSPFPITSPRPSTASPITASATPSPVIEEDDLDVPVNAGTKCRRNGCGTVFVTDDVNRKGDGDGTVCTYHPAPVSPFQIFQAHLFISIPCSPSLEKGVR